MSEHVRALVITAEDHVTSCMRSDEDVADFPKRKIVSRRADLADKIRVGGFAERLA
jgi:hypothetical protein